MVCPNDGEVLNASQNILPGNKYALEREIASGGWGTVYLARHQTLGSNFAVKMLSPELCQNLRNIQRFGEEATTLAKLEHDGIVKVLDYGLKPRPYIVMEYIDGTLLSELIERETIGEGKLISIMHQLCAILEYAHGMGIVHRDLKPKNIIVRATDTDHPVVKLVDFGIARLAESQALDAASGSIQYMSPEQFAGEVNTASDIYALGCLLFECITRRHAFTGNTFSDWRSAHINDLPGLKAGDNKLSPAKRDLLKLAMQCMAKDPAERPTAEEARELVEDIRDDHNIAPAGKKIGTGPRQKNKTLTVFAGIAISVLVLVSGTMVFLKPPQTIPLKESSRKNLIKTLAFNAESSGIQTNTIEPSAEMRHSVKSVKLLKPATKATSIVFILQNQESKLTAISSMAEHWASNGSLVLIAQPAAKIGSTSEMNSLIQILLHLVKAETTEPDAKSGLVAVEQDVESTLNVTTGVAGKDSKAMSAIVLINPVVGHQTTGDVNALHGISIPIFYIVDSNIRGPSRHTTMRRCEEAFTYTTGAQVFYNSVKVSLRSDMQRLDEQVLSALLDGYLDAMLCDNNAKETYLFSQQSVQAVAASGSLKMRCRAVTE